MGESNDTLVMSLGPRVWPMGVKCTSTDFFYYILLDLYNYCLLIFSKLREFYIEFYGDAYKQVLDLEEPLKSLTMTTLYNDIVRLLYVMKASTKLSLY
jgi:hypothetical protein